MIPRPFWQAVIEQAWTRRPVVWLTGVRRVGKTVLARSLPGVEYFDCERPRVRRQSFRRLVELLMAQSGGIFEATRFARECEISRTTVTNYLAVLEATFVAHVVRPYASRRAQEIVAAPKVHGFDTGLVCHHRGWDSLRREDIGLLWEHFVLNELHARLQSRRISYWRSKHGNEVDFVLAPAADRRWRSSASGRRAISIRRAFGLSAEDTRRAPTSSSPPTWTVRTTSDSASCGFASSGSTGWSKR